MSISVNLVFGCHFYLDLSSKLCQNVMELINSKMELITEKFHFNFRQKPEPKEVIAKNKTNNFMQEFKHM